MREELANLIAELELSPGKLVTKTERLTDERALRQRLREIEGDGWVCCVSHTPTRWSDGGDLPPSRVLSVEICCGEERSVHVRQRGDHWTWLELIASEGGEHRMQGVTYLSTVPANGGAAPRMKYERWYREETRDGVSVWTPFAARFVGWED